MGAGGLGNDFGSTRLTGPEQGQASFTSHATTGNKQWMEEAMRRRTAIGSLRDTPAPKTTLDYERNYLKKTNPKAPCAGASGPCIGSLDAKPGLLGKKETPVEKSPTGKQSGDAAALNREIPVPKPSHNVSEGREDYDYTKQPGYSVFEAAGGTFIDVASKSGVPIVSQVALGAKLTLDTLDVTTRGQVIYNNEQERRIKMLDEIVKQQHLYKNDPEKLKALTERAKAIQFGEYSTYIGAQGIALAEKAVTSKAGDMLPGSAPGGAREAVLEIGKTVAGDKVIKPVVEEVTGRTFELSK